MEWRLPCEFENTWVCYSRLLLFCLLIGRLPSGLADSNNFSHGYINCVFISRTIYKLTRCNQSPFYLIIIILTLLLNYYRIHDMSTMIRHAATCISQNARLILMFLLGIPQCRNSAVWFSFLLLNQSLPRGTLNNRKKSTYDNYRWQEFCNENRIYIHTIHHQNESVVSGKETINEQVSKKKVNMKR